MRIPLKVLLLIPFFPLIQFLRIQRRYGWIAWKQWQVLSIWMLKCILIEPLRLIEATVMAVLPQRKVRPIFVLGFYRSGTTYLQELLAADPNHRTLTLFQSLLPELSLCFGWLLEPVFTLTARVLGAKNEFHNIGLYGTFPGEEDVAINALSAVHDYNKVYQYPSRYACITDHYLRFCSNPEAARWTEYHQYLTQKLAYIYGNKPLILKSPPNTARIDVLKRIYPDAKFLFISRNPADVIQSSRRLWELNRRFSFERYDEAQVTDILLDQYLVFHELYHGQRANVHCPEILFQDLVADSPGTMAKLYAELGLPGWAAAAPCVEKIAQLRKQKSVKTYTPDTVSVHVRYSQLNRLIKTLGYAE